MSTVSTPIVVEGHLWGFINVVDLEKESPADAEPRLENFTELVAAAVANADGRAELAASEARALDLATEQAALRRVATLVAQGALPEEVCSAVSNEVGRLFGSGQAAVGRFEPDGAAIIVVGKSDDVDFASIGARWELEEFLAATEVYRTGRPARKELSVELASGPVADRFRRVGLVGSAAAPVVVEGSLWGAIAVGHTHMPLPADTEHRLGKFTELVAAAVANAEGRAELAASEARAQHLAREQAALRRVATLVAQGTSAEELFAAVASEVSAVVGVPVVGMNRYESDDAFTLVGISGDTTFILGSRWPVERQGLAGTIRSTGRPVRNAAYTGMPGPLGEALRADEIVSTVGVPIVVDGSIWGFIVAGAGRATRFPPAQRSVWSASANWLRPRSPTTRYARASRGWRMSRRRCGRVATLVARGARPEDVFSAVSDEVAQLFGSLQAGVARFEPDGSGLVMVGVSQDLGVVSIGQRWELEESLGLDTVYETGRPARSADDAFENPSGRSPRASATSASSLSLAHRSSSKGIGGASSPTRRRKPRLPTPNSGSRSSLSWWPRRLPTPRAGARSPRPKRARSTSRASRQHCAGSRRWSPAGLAPRRSSRR